MRTANNGSNNYTYGVNGLDERVEKTSGSTTYYYIYAGVGQLLGIYNNAGQAVDEMVYLGKKPVASVRSGVVYNVETDNLNTPVRVLDQNNTIDWSWEGKEPFGLSQPTQAVVNGSNFIFNMRFPGQYADQETGLFQNGYREYDPSTGRYMEVDPLGLNSGWNPYNYIGSNPLNLYDPYSLWTWGDPLPQGLVDFSAGMGDAISFNLTSEIRNMMGTNCVVNKNSTNYFNGVFAGLVTSTLSGGIVENLAVKGLTKGSPLLYHFTSLSAWAGISKEGINLAENTLYGPGVYGTVFSSNLWARFAGANSTTVLLEINTEELEVIPTIFPGTFRIPTAVPLSAIKRIR
jgi:RHS repeat-associated protein